MKKILLLLTLVAVMGVGAGSALAQDRVPERAMEAREANQGETRSCEAIQARLDARARFLEGRRNYHLSWLRRIENRINELVAILEEKGYDTQEIDAMMAELDEMITLASDHYQVFLVKLTVTKELVCTDPQAARTAFAEAKTALEVFREDIKGIRDYIKQTILPLVIDLKSQRPARDSQ